MGEAQFIFASAASLITIAVALLVMSYFSANIIDSILKRKNITDISPKKLMISIALAGFLTISFSPPSIIWQGIIGYLLSLAFSKFIIKKHIMQISLMVFISLLATALVVYSIAIGFFILVAGSMH